MVCIPCIVIPLFLWIFHRFLQPLIMPYLPEKAQKWFNVRMKGYGIVKDEDSTTDSEGKSSETKETDDADQTSNGTAKCPFSLNGSTAKEVSAGSGDGDKKND